MPGTGITGPVLLSVAALAGYLLLVRRLRHQRMRSILSKYCRYVDSPEAINAMTPEDAFAIQALVAEVEFPSMFSVALFLALFQAFGIPSISRLLVATGELSRKSTASKRAADTGVLVTEIVFCAPGTDRSVSAIARMNWIHDRYRKSGAIRDDDMLYTLGLFALEPIRWVQRFEWRALTDLERCAIAVCWKKLGDVMGISYSPLPSGARGWQNGLEWLEELETWSKQYEIQHMTPSTSNTALAISALNVVLTNVPRMVKPVAAQFAVASFSPRLRTALAFDKPPLWVRGGLSLVLSIRKLLLRHLFLPRPLFMRKKWSSEAEAKTGYYNSEHYIAHPWYARPASKCRWSCRSWILLLTGGYVPSHNTPEFRPQGYRIPDVGPAGLEGQSTEDVEAAKHMIRKMQACPFHPGK
ncbi:uncharacterized protein UV8b_07095 [Ustilaginoidea virens]|uniref:ER-bound oxygenase mpaB/mpaB'/Rubber oxygenase catalytic domain-containing protein n=1 Tax=Ustilaginoidea virens TaxID=1159556 RepID=A0A063CAW9_USTVR|nr:uncharacterized protein UV8b_07095 [Ustilaginoidea virens]QUC22854.1 hypothetical protein UV8b_07095 [Ustilaginoidea virens]GAO15346.1 hypothetical protein UVI_02010130 [Ustilaginoidea virens]